MSFLRRLNVRLPIIQAPMAGTSTPEMAAAVSNAGGLGSLGLGASDVETSRKAIRRVQQLTDKAFNVNFFVHKPAVVDQAVAKRWIEHLRPAFEAYDAQPPKELREIYQSFDGNDAMVKMLLETRPPVISFHFGLPTVKVVQQLKDTGAVLLASVTSLEEARKAEVAGMDCLVVSFPSSKSPEKYGLYQAQGYEAGGHRGIFDPFGTDDKLSTAPLLQILLKETSLPIIAAGGIMDGRGIQAALTLGAVAAQLGTAFVLTEESAVDEAYRRAMKSEAARHTTMTSLISGRPARCLSNKFTAVHEIKDMPNYPLVYDIGKALNAAAKAKGEGGYGAQWAGQGAPLAREMSCADLMQTLESELRDLQ